MDRWEIPSCIVCYERLLSNLCVLPKCGHIYHEKCLNAWIEKAALHRNGCPLCRKPIELDSILRLKYDIAERDEEKSKAETGGKGGRDDNKKLISKEVLLELRLKLKQASADNLELKSSCYKLECEKRRLEEEVKNEIKSKDELIEQNKELKIAQAAQKTTVARLNEIISHQKVKMNKLKSVHNYLESNKKSNITSDNVNVIFKSLNNDEKILLLNNRIIELEQFVQPIKSINIYRINKTLSDLRDNWKKKCDNINQDYLALEREYKNLLSFYNSKYGIVENAVKSPVTLLRVNNKMSTSISDLVTTPPLLDRKRSKTISGDSEIKFVTRNYTKSPTKLGNIHNFFKTHNDR